MRIAGIINRYLYRKTGSPISEGARTETTADDRSWKSQGFPITHRRADRMASDSVIKSPFQAPWPNINFLMYLLKHLHLLESMALLQSSLQSSCPPAQSVSIHTQNRQDMKRALQWILCTVKEVI